MHSQHAECETLPVERLGVFRFDGQGLVKHFDRFPVAFQVDQGNSFFYKSRKKNG